LKDTYVSAMLVLNIIHTHTSLN